MLPVAANALIKVTPGLMIWTIVCFLIALFVLKRYAFGPIQGAIDARRERIRESIDEADRAREEARNAARGAPQADRQGQGRRGGDPRRGPQAGGCPARARPRGDRGRPAAPPGGDEEADRRGDPARARADPLRGRRAGDRRHLEGDRQGARPRRPPEADRGRDQRPRLLRAGAERLGRERRPPHVRAVAVRGREGGRELADVAGAARRLRRGASARCRSSARSCATPSSTSGRRLAAVDAVAGDADPLVRNLLRLLDREGPRRGGRGGRRGVRAAGRRARRASSSVELTTAFELSDDEARAIVEPDRAAPPAGRSRRRARSTPT